MHHTTSPTRPRHNQSRRSLRIHSQSLPPTRRDDSQRRSAYFQLNTLDRLPSSRRREDPFRRRDAFYIFEVDDNATIRPRRNQSRQSLRIHLQSLPPTRREDFQRRSAYFKLDTLDRLPSSRRRVDSFRCRDAFYIFEVNDNNNNNNNDDGDDDNNNDDNSDDDDVDEGEEDER